MAFVYVLECADRSLYVGSTRSLEQRLTQHQLGQGAAYTRDRLPVRLVYSEEFENIGEAFAREKQIQNWGR
ncbi:GIY-YIG nuclease family protein, partial [Nocardioides sp.]|uniref:GIY-YIG nuclease family protein n=1 Tax=Nocardioides sp. TaxID=35761 RepID=UPI0027371693